MEVILLKDFDGLGEAGDIVIVKPGFARNKLIPEGIALRASKRNLAIAEERKRTLKNRNLREQTANETLLNTLSKTEITIETQVGDEDKMFGSVTSIDIHKALKEKGLEIDRNSIMLDEPIKALGIYHVPIKIRDGYIILFIKDKIIEEEEIDIDQIVKRRITYEMNNKLSEFSRQHFKKVAINQEIEWTINL